MIFCTFQTRGSLVERSTSTLNVVRLKSSSVSQYLNKRGRELTVEDRKEEKRREEKERKGQKREERGEIVYIYILIKDELNERSFMTEEMRNELRDEKKKERWAREPNF